MIRRIALLASGLLIVAVVAIVGLVAFRASLAEILLRRQLSAMAASPVQVTVTSIGLNAIHLADLAVGPTLTVQRLSASYRLPDLLDGRLETLLLESPRLALDLTGGDPLLGPLAPLLTGEPGTSKTSLPAIRIARGRLEANTAVGPVTVQLDGRLDPLPDHQIGLEGEYRLESRFGSLAGVVSAAGDPSAEILGTLLVDQGTVAYSPLGLAADKLAGAVAFELNQGRPSQVTVSLTTGDLSVDRLAAGEGYLALDIAGDLIAVDAALRTADGSLDLEVSGEALPDGPKTELWLQGRIVAESLARLSPLVPLADGLEGEIRARFDLSGKFPAMQLAELDAGFLTQWVLGGGLTGSVSAEAENLSLGDAVQGGRGRVSADISLAGHGLTLTSSEPTAFAVERLGHDALRAWGLPPPFAGLLTGGGTLDLAGPGDRARVRVSRGDEAVEIEATGTPTLTLPGGMVLEAGGTLRASLGPDLMVRGYTVQDLSLRGQGLVLGDLETETLTLSGQLEGLGHDFALTGLTAGITGVTVGGAALPSAKVAGDLSGSSHGVSGSLLLSSTARRTAVGDLAVSDFRLSAPIDLTIVDGTLVARLAGQGSLEAARLTVGDRLILEEGGGLVLGHAALSIPLAGPGQLPLTFDVQMRPKPIAGPWRGKLNGRGGPPVPFTVRPAAIVLSGTQDQHDRIRAKYDVGLQSLWLPNPDLTFLGARMAGSLDHTSGTAQAQIRIHSLGLEERLALSQPVGLLGQLKAAEGRIVFAGGLTGPAPFDRAHVTFVHRLDSATGEARVELGELAFAPGALEPSDLSAFLSPLSEVIGDAHARAEVAWSSDKVVSQGQVKLSDMSLTYADMTLAGLSLDLRLDDLLRLRSPPGQSVMLERLDGPVVVESLSGRFQIELGNPARIRVQQMDFRSIGGTFSVQDFLLDPGADMHEAVLEVRSLDLDRLTRALEIEGVSGSGNLSGRVPMRFEGGRAVITDAQLESTGPGILRYRSAASASLVDDLKGDTDLNSLALVDDPFRLTLLALENFHYESLGVRMGHQADGRANLKLALRGKNPEVLDGYPFELNVNLDTNLVPLLEAIDDGLIVTKDLLPGKWRFGR